MAARVLFGAVVNMYRYFWPWPAFQTFCSAWTLFFLAVLPGIANQRIFAHAFQSGELLKDVESRRQENQLRKLRISSERLALIPRQTVTSMAASVGTFERWLWSNYTEETRTITEIPPVELDEFLAEFMLKVVTPSGADYKPRSFAMLRSCLGRYLKETNYPETILTSPLFVKSREAYHARKRDIEYRESLALTSEQKGRETCWKIVSLIFLVFLYHKSPVTQTSDRRIISTLVKHVPY